jgi:hypothetical protein
MLKWYRNLKGRRVRKERCCTRSKRSAYGNMSDVSLVHTETLKSTAVDNDMPQRHVDGRTEHCLTGKHRRVAIHIL